jgi:uncharacterized protein YndB with AHSA1/START domain
MASICRETHIDASPSKVWSALRAVDELHTRLCPGFVMDTRMEGNTRVVTFGNGMTAREDILGVDDDRMRVAWAIVGQKFHHYQGVARVEPDGDGTKFIWMTDLLPDELAPGVEAMMAAGLDVIRKTLEAD